MNAITERILEELQATYPVIEPHGHTAFSVRQAALRGLWRFGRARGYDDAAIREAIDELHEIKSTSRRTVLSVVERYFEIQFEGAA